MSTARPELPEVLARAIRIRVLALASVEEQDGLPSVEPLRQLVRALRSARPEHRGPALDILLGLLDEPVHGAAARAYLGRLLRTIRARSSLADLGLLPAHGLFAELRERLIGTVLPSHRPPHELREVLSVLFDPVDATWLATVDDARIDRLLRALRPDDETARRTLAHDTLRAIDLLSHRLAAAGEDPVLLTFDPGSMDHDSPFLAQAEHVLELTLSLRKAIDGLGPWPDLEVAPVSVMLTQCEEQITRMRRRAPHTGATIRMNYELERLDDLRERLVLLVACFSEDEAGAASAHVALLRALVEGQAEAERILPLMRRGSHLVAREIASRAGRTGEHYITRTPSEWGKMWLAAGGAGLIVAVLACIKVMASKLHAPPLVEAALFSLNYAVGFAIVGFLGLTIATKQPAMTAAALASAIEPSETKGGSVEPASSPTRRLVETIQALVRSQLAAILGNCLVALPAALLLSLGTAWLIGAPIADVEKAEHLAHELDPFTSLALAHAALTGVFLSISGIVAGYVTSSVIARHVPERIARAPRLVAVLGRPRAARLAAATESGAGALAGSIVLGILLGSTGTFGALLGLPLDIRHVSFGSANLGLALATLGVEGLDLGRLVLGLVGVGALNLSVSFSLSLGLALHASGRSLKDLPGLARELAQSLVRELPSWLVPVGRSAQPLACALAIAVPLLLDHA